MKRKSLSFPPVEPAGLSLKEGLKWIAIGLIIAHLSLLTLPITQAAFKGSSEASDNPAVLTEKSCRVEKQ